MQGTMPAPPPAAANDAALSGAAWQFAAETHDIDTFAAAQPQWSLHYQQISSGRFAGQLRHVQLPGLRMVHERTSCATRQRGRLCSGHVGFAMPLGLSGHAAFNGQPLSGDSMMIGPSEELDLCLPAEAGLIGIVVDFALLAQLWEHMYRKPLSAWIERQLVVQAMPAPAEALRQEHLATMAGIAQRPELLADPDVALQLRDAILMEWIEAIPSRVDTDDLAVGEARKRMVDRACDLMLSQPETPMTILQVCDRIGASPRKLEYCFRSVLGISPAKYLRAARLDGVRRELSRGQSASVQDIAARWGFWHLGEFAAAYRRQFGELPSQTLRGRPGA